MNDTQHSPAHQARKPRSHICGVCGRLFARREHVRRHVLSHTGEKPFKCADCARKFARRDLLSRHRKKLHAENRTPLQCKKRRVLGSKTQTSIVGKEVTGYIASAARKTQAMPTLAIHNILLSSGTPRESILLDHEFGMQGTGVDCSQIKAIPPGCSHANSIPRHDPFSYQTDDPYYYACPIDNGNDGEITPVRCWRSPRPTLRVSRLEDLQWRL